MLQHEQEHSQHKDEAIDVAAHHREAEAAVEPHAGAHAAPAAASFEQLTGQHGVEAAPAKAAAPPKSDSTTVSDAFLEQVAHGMAYKDALDDNDENRSGCRRLVPARLSASAR